MTGLPLRSNGPPKDGQPKPADAAAPAAGPPASSIAKPDLRVVAALTALVLGYAALSHYSESTPDARGLGAGLAVGPVIAITLLLLWRWVNAVAALVFAAFTAGLLYAFWPVLERHFQWADLVQQCGAYALVALLFARSLVAGREPLCTQLAARMYGALTPIEVAYTRRATVFWSVFYGVLSAAILVLFWVAPLRVWSMFVNFGTFGLIILVGIGDHAIRRRVLPRHAGGGILQVIQRSLIG